MTPFNPNHNTKPKPIFLNPKAKDNHFTIVSLFQFHIGTTDAEKAISYAEVEDMVLKIKSACVHHKVPLESAVSILMVLFKGFIITQELQEKKAHSTTTRSLLLYSLFLLLLFFFSSGKRNKVIVCESGTNISSG